MTVLSQQVQCQLGQWLPSTRPFGLRLMSTHLAIPAFPSHRKTMGNPFRQTPGKGPWNHVGTVLYRSPGVKQFARRLHPTRRSGWGHDPRRAIEEPYLNVWGHSAMWRSALLGRPGTPNTPARGVVRPLGAAQPPDTGTQPS